MISGMDVDEAKRSFTTLNVKEYVSRYSGSTRVRRLLFIATKDYAARDICLDIAFAEIKKGADIFDVG